MASFHDFTMQTIDGETRSLGDYAGKVCLVVNVASKCGLTPQYEGLQRLYDAYREWDLNAERFDGPSYKRLATIREMLAKGRLGSDLRWN